MKTSVPIYYNIITPENKYTVLDYLKRGEIDRVFLVFMAAVFTKVILYSKNILT